MTETIRDAMRRAIHSHGLDDDLHCACSYEIDCICKALRLNPDMLLDTLVRRMIPPPPPTPPRAPRPSTTKVDPPGWFARWRWNPKSAGQ